MDFIRHNGRVFCDVEHVAEWLIDYAKSLNLSSGLSPHTVDAGREMANLSNQILLMGGEAKRQLEKKPPKSLARRR